MAGEGVYLERGPEGLKRTRLMTELTVERTHSSPGRLMENQFVLSPRGGEEGGREGGREGVGAQAGQQRMVEQKEEEEEEEEEEEVEEEGEGPREKGMQKFAAGTFFTPLGGRPMAIDACVSNTSLASSPITTAFASPSSCSSSSLHSSPHHFVIASNVVISGRAGGMNDESYASSSSSSSSYSFNDSGRGGRGEGGGAYLPTLQLHPHQQRSLDVTSVPQCSWAVGTAGSLPGTPLRQQWAKAEAGGEGLQGSGFGGGGGGGGGGKKGQKKPTHRRSVAVVPGAGPPAVATAGQEEEEQAEF